MRTIGLLEIKVLAVILRRTTYIKYKDILQINFFKSSELKYIYKTVIRLHEKFHKPRVNLTDIWLLLEKRLDEEEHTRYKKLLIKIKEQYILMLNQDQDIIHYSITRFAQENMLKQALHSRVQELESGMDVDLSDLKIQVDKIISLDGNKKVLDYDYMSSHKERHDPKKEPPRIPTGIAELDDEMQGGLAPGELGFFLAPPGRGKTFSLVNMGASALRQGKRVLHVTLEIPARSVGIRYDCCLTESTKEEVRENPITLFKKLKEIKKSGSELLIKDYSYIHCSIAELHNILQERINSGKPIDLLIVDYGDLMVPPQKYKDTRHEVAKIYEELRIIAGYFNVPVWTASQGNRVSLSKRTIDMRDIAEAFAKANVADIIIAVCQTEEEKMEKEMRLYVAKTRMGETNPTIPVVADLKRMLMRSPNNYDKEIHWNRPGMKSLKKKVIKK